MNPFIILCVRLLLMLCCLLSIEGRRHPLNQYILHYEGLSYDTEALRRQANRDETLRLRFHSHGRDFDLRMRRDTAQFSPNLTVEVSGEPPMDIGDIDFIYAGRGTLDGHKNATVYAQGSVIDGHFEGHVKTRRGTYYVEPSDRYFRGRNVSYHSVIYHEDDVRYTYERGGGGGCGAAAAQPPAAEKMQSTGREERPADEQPPPEHWDPPPEHRDPPSEHRDPPPEHRDPPPEHRDLADERPLALAVAPEEATTCELSIHTDHLFFQRYGSRQKVMEQIANHVKSLNSIYGRTDFGVRVNFAVKSVLINTSAAARGDSNPFANPALTAGEFLYAFTQQDHDAYCLAYVFTDRSFAEGVLGLAWPGTACGAPHRCGKDGARCSRNTGLVTVRVGDDRVPPVVSHLVFAHEVGHSLGAPHDTAAPECVPNEGKGWQGPGNYIMYPHASSGARPNNRRFSPCAVRAIGNHLRSPGGRSCFVKSERPVCGDGRAEGDATSSATAATASAARTRAATTRARRTTGGAGGDPSAVPPVLAVLRARRRDAEEHRPVDRDVLVGAASHRQRHNVPHNVILSLYC